MSLVRLGQAQVAQSSQTVPTNQATLSKKAAIAAAEQFLAGNGGGAQSSLQPKAVEARLEDNLWFVGFRGTSLPILRAIIVDARTGAARLASQNIQEDWLRGRDNPSAAAAVPAISTSTATAPGKADKKKKKGKAKKPAASAPATSATPGN